MTRFSVVSLIACITVFTTAFAVHESFADVLLLRRGGRVEGQIVKRPNGNEGYWVVKVDGGTYLRVKPTDVGRLVERSNAERKYEKLVATVPDTTKGHAKLAEWCHANKLRGERDFHWEQVLRHDPDDEVARKNLGFRRMRGTWVRPDDYMRQQGYVKVGTVWRTPEQVEIEERKRKLELATKGWNKEIKLWRSWLRGRRRDEARRRFAEIEDPLAVPGLREALKDESDPDLRLILVESLSRLPGASATEGLIHLALQDPESDIRARSIEALTKRTGHRRMIADAFVGALTSPTNSMIQRAGSALVQLGDRESVLPLIDALKTTHVSISKPGPQISTSFGSGPGSGGLGGLNVGGAPKKKTTVVENRSVLRALVTITDKNFGFSKTDWKRWFVDEFTLPDDVNLRRDS